MSSERQPQAPRRSANPDSSTSVRLWVPTLLICILILSLFGALYWPLRHLPGPLSPEEARYVELATGVNLDVIEPPMTLEPSNPGALRPPLAIAALGLSLDDELSIPAVRSVAWAWTLVGLALILCGGWLVAGRMGLFAGVLVGCMPTFWFSAQRATLDGLFAGLFFLALACAARALNGQSAFWLSAALVGSLALYVRYTALLLIPIVAVVLLLFLRSPLAAQRKGNGRGIGRLMQAITLAIVACLPWLVWQWKTSGNPFGGFIEAAALIRSAESEIGRPVWFYVGSLPSMVTWPTLLLAAYGLVRGVRSRREVVLFGAATLFLLLWFSGYGFKHEILLLPALPCIGLLASLGFQEFTLQLDRLGTAGVPRDDLPKPVPTARRRALRWRPTVLCLALLWLIVQLARTGVETRIDAHLEYQQATGLRAIDTPPTAVSA